ncbi:hypothetical protein [Winslowiella iniecta]|uniref:hypothetical protein n=1 Tax=Winslowiella iniecta TaxID=1560201 RepID=UPI0012E3146C|nr:hypothetical protein [Winslowiella iniecta]
MPAIAPIIDENKYKVKALLPFLSPEVTFYRGDKNPLRLESIMSAISGEDHGAAK